MSEFNITVAPSDAAPYSNEYRQKMADDFFVETIRIDPQSCVFSRWATTQYEAATHLV